jgi:DNA polymerase III delta prime subunit
MTNITQRLRSAVQTLRRTPMPIADIAPMLQEAADTIDAAELELEAFDKAENSFMRKAIELEAENAALLEALKGALWRMEGYGYQAMEGTIAQARAAIAAAEGEKP